MMKSRFSGSEDAWEGPEPTDSANALGVSSEFVVLATDDDPGMLKFYEVALAGERVRVQGTADPQQGLHTLACQLLNHLQQPIAGIARKLGRSEKAVRQMLSSRGSTPKSAEP